MFRVDLFLQLALKDDRQLSKAAEFIGVTLLLVPSQNQVIREVTEIPAISELHHAFLALRG